MKKILLCLLALSLAGCFDDEKDIATKNIFLNWANNKCKSEGMRFTGNVNNAESNGSVAFISCYSDDGERAESFTIPRRR